MNESPFSLFWTPFYNFLENQISLNNNPIIFISPFIKIKPLNRILAFVHNKKNLKLITRWSPKDIISEASDIEIYPTVKELGIPLYINDRIHLKLFVFNSNEALHTSGNITDRGLGYIENSNIEIGCMVNIKQNDWKKLYQLINSSSLVNDDIYSAVKQYKIKNKNKLLEILPSLKIPKNDFLNEFSLSSLPALSSTMMA